MDETTQSLLRHLTPTQRFVVGVEARQEITSMAEGYLAEHREALLCASLERIAQRERA
jgi:hypothetical protein